MEDDREVIREWLGCNCLIVVVLGRVVGGGGGGLRVWLLEYEIEELCRVNL